MAEFFIFFFMSSNVWYNTLVNKWANKFGRCWEELFFTTKLLIEVQFDELSEMKTSVTSTQIKVQNLTTTTEAPPLSFLVFISYQM